jgi:dihydroflavonol-4-reductase
MARDLGVDVVSVNPSSVQGPGRATGTGKLLVDYLNGKLKFFVDTRVGIVDIDDCARGHLLAEARGVGGERYILNGHSIDTRALLKLADGVANVKRRPLLLPRGLASAAAAALDAAGRTTGKTLPVCGEMVRTLVHGHDYDGSRATRDLGLTYSPLEETLRRTVAWLVDQRMTSAA